MRRFGGASMSLIPNFPEVFADEHHAWHEPGVHPEFPSRAIPRGNPGSGIEFLVFHRNFMAKVLAWYRQQSFADSNAVAPWTSIPEALKRTAFWNAQEAADELRIVTLRPAFASEDDFGIFVENGIHNRFLHDATAAAFNEPVVATLHSPQSTFFYQIHGLVQNWWSNWFRHSGWHHGVPGAGQMRVAPGTSPTSWYTTPENVQHVGYVGADDGLIHECFFFIS
jgi:hypothetical protein